MAIDINDGIFAAFREAGSSDSQIEDAKLVLGPLCEMRGHVCVLSATGEALDSEKSIKWLQENKPHLLPRTNQIADAELDATETCGYSTGSACGRWNSCSQRVRSAKL